MTPDANPFLTAHLVVAEDEHRHPPDADDLWNESYYADFVQRGRDLRRLVAPRAVPKSPRGLVDDLHRRHRPQRGQLGQLHGPGSCRYGVGGGGRSHPN